jgi:murein DD-endopeptidase MepM/ murein hydrolase activator NlpD
MDEPSWRDHVTRRCVETDAACSVDVHRPGAQAGFGWRSVCTCLSAGTSRRGERVIRRHIVALTAVTAAIGIGWVGALGASQASKKTPTAITIEVLPGALARWSVPGTKRCVMGRRAWDALQETCYYPIDVLEKPGVVRVRRLGAGPAASAQIVVQPQTPARETIALGDIPQAKPSPADLKRNARDQALVAKLWTKREGPARFTLPLGPPAKTLPEGKGFGSLWVFAGPPETTDLHSGVDYAIPEGTPLTSVADGVVTLADDLFFAGNAVFIDHGDGLVSMYFHLADLKVRAGQEVRKGETIGTVGSTGRVTGPHLHFGVRWHGARIDPAPLFADPAKIPAIAP